MSECFADATVMADYSCNCVFKFNSLRISLLFMLIKLEADFPSKCLNIEIILGSES